MRSGRQHVLLRALARGVLHHDAKSVRDSLIHSDTCIRTFASTALESPGLLNRAPKQDMHLRSSSKHPLLHSTALGQKNESGTLECSIGTASEAATLGGEAREKHPCKKCFRSKA